MTRQLMSDTEILDHIQAVLDKRVGSTALDVDLGGMVITIRPGHQNNIRQLFTNQILNHFGRLVAASLE